MASPPRAALRSCALVCMSILDYLLPLDAWNRVENILLLPRYGALKWTDYQLKMGSMVKCLMDVPLVSSHDKLGLVPPFLHPPSGRKPMTSPEVCDGVIR